MYQSTKRSPLDDIEYLARSDHRVMALAALARRPQSRTDLRVMTQVSQSTIGRTLREFEDRRWIQRSGKEYEATQLGKFVARGMWDLIERIETEHKLRDIWPLLPDEEAGFTIEMCADAVVTVAESDDPYRPVNRFISLLQGTDHLRFAGFDVALLEPCKDKLCQQIINGMDAELIDPPNVIKYIRSTCSERFSETLESGNLTVWLRDDLPHYGVGIFDERVAIIGYNPDSGMVQVVIDTDDPDAREWAESLYESYQREIPTIGIEKPAE